MPFINDYKLNLIEPFAMSDKEFMKLRTDLRGVLYGAKYAHDNDKLLDCIADPNLGGLLQKDAMELFAAITNYDFEPTNISNNPQENSEARMKLSEYCIEKGRLEGIQEGKIDGAIIMMTDSGISSSVICQKITEKLGVEKSLVEQRMELMGIRL